MKRERLDCSPCRHLNGYDLDNDRNGAKRVGTCTSPSYLVITSALSSCLWHTSPISSPASLLMRILLVFAAC